MDHDIEPGRLPQNPLPVAYTLQLTIDPNADRFTGQVEIELAVDRAVDAIHLHALGLEFDRIELHSASGPRVLQVSPASGEGREPDQGEITLFDGEPLRPGPCTLKIDFQGAFGGNMCGLYKVFDGGDPYVVTQFEAADARRCFPCFDEPAFKVPFTLSVKVPEMTACFSNAPETGREEAAGGTCVHFAQTPPLPTYLLALCVGPFEIIEAETVAETPVRVIVPRGKGHLAGFARRVTPELLGALEALFGLPYPYAKLDVVAVPEFAAGAMENAGLVTFREIYLLADESNLTRARARQMAEVIAHELAHHWFGNLVTMRWWDDLWLNEAFATWVAARVVDAWKPEFEQVLALLEIRGRVMAQDALPAARQIRQPVMSVSDAEQAFDAITYLKGAAVLETLERWIGDATFDAGVRTYLEAHRWGNATGEDLFAALDSASGKDVSGVCRSYIEQPGVPLLTIDEDGRSVRQAPYALLGLEAPHPEATWQIPIHLEGGKTYVLKEREGQLPAPLEGGHPNPQEATYLRWTLPPRAMRALIADAASRDVREQLGLLDAAWAAVAAGATSIDTYLEAMWALRTSHARPVVEQVAGCPARLANLFPGLSDQPAFQRFSEEITQPSLDRLGLQPVAGEDDGDAIARPAVLASAGRHGHSERVLAHVRAEAARALAGELPSPEVARVVLALASREGEISVDQLASALFHATDPERRTALLSGLSQLPPGAAADDALALLLDERFRAQDFGAVFHSMMRRHETRPQAFAWLDENFASIRLRQPEFTFIHIGQIVGEFRKLEPREAAVARLRSKAIRGGERSIEQGMQASTHAIALVHRFEGPVQAFLDQRA